MSNLITNIVGASTSLATPVKDFNLLQVGIGDDGKAWVYVQTNAAISATKTGTLAAGIFTPTATSPTHTAVVTSAAASDYLWVYQTDSPFA